MQRLFKHTKKGLILALFALVALAGASQVYANSFYNIPHNSTTAVDEWGVCNKVTNNNAPTIFVPTNTSAEWSAFRGHATGVSLGSCDVYGCTTSGYDNYNSSATVNDGSCSCNSGRQWNGSSCVTTVVGCTDSRYSPNGNYNSSANSSGSCSCNSGYTWNGSSCTPQACSASGACGAASSGSTCSTNTTSSVSYPSTCPSNFSSTCNNGTWSPTPGNYSSCTVTNNPCGAQGACPATSSGSSCTTYSTGSVSYPSTCPSSITSTCNNGTWSQTPGNYSSCTVTNNPCGAQGACSAASSGSTCTTYSASSGSSCPATTSTCNNGTWSPTPGNYGSCTLTCPAQGACPSGTNGATCSSNTTSSVTSPSTCPANFTSTCTSGAWSPTPGNYSSCAVAGCTDPSATNYDPNATVSNNSCTYASCRQINDCSQFDSQGYPNSMYACNAYNPDFFGFYECQWNGSNCVDNPSFSCSNFNSNQTACNETMRCDYF